MPIVFLALAAIASGGAAIATGTFASRPTADNSLDQAILIGQAVIPDPSPSP